MNKRRIIVSVINDLVTDQRVHRSCLLLYEMGYDVNLVGRVRRNSPPLEPRPYATRRMRLLFEKGALFYACFNIRLFFLLITHRADGYLSNDLDTLLPNFLVSRIKRKPLLYDAHEYYTGVPELKNRPGVRRVWKCIEKHIIPFIRYMVTVNESIAALYAWEYDADPVIVRNVPVRHSHSGALPVRKDLGLPDDRKIIILQGSGINIQRGAEEAVEAMRFLDGVLLLIVGDGDVISKLKELVHKYTLQEKVLFLPRMPMEQLRDYTRLADGGLTLDKAHSINYRYSLPNKLFDYIHAGIPVLASNLPEVRKVIQDYHIGLVVKDHKPENLAQALKRLLFDQELRNTWLTNLPRAADELCWDREKKILEELFTKAYGG